MSWKEFLAIVHTNMGMPGRKVITIPNWMLDMGIKFMEKKIPEAENENGVITENGICFLKSSDIQSAECYIDRTHGCIPLGVEDDDIEKAIGESIRMAVDVLDGKIKNVIGMKGE